MKIKFYYQNRGFGRTPSNPPWVRACIYIYIYYELLCLLITQQRGIEMYGKYKHNTLFIKLYTLPPYLTMFPVRITLLFINYFKGRYYISAQIDPIVLQHFIQAYKNDVALPFCICRRKFHIYIYISNMRVCLMSANRMC